VAHEHLSRKELRTDEVRETLAHGAEAVLTHQRLVAYLVGIALVVGLSVFGWRFYTERQTVKAGAEFSDAMKIFQARIRAPGEPAEPGEITYVAEKNKFEDALKKFNEVADHYPRTRPGQLARYYAALCLERLTRNEEAHKGLETLVGGGDEDFAGMARFELAQFDDRTGKGDEAVTLYRQLIANPSALVPKPVVMLALASHYSKSNPAEAAKLYNQIKTEYPDSAVSEQANQQLELLPGKT
jgi:hypothetical protein